MTDFCPDLKWTRARRGAEEKGADLVLLDPEEISDRTTYLHSSWEATGIAYVITNRKVVRDTHGHLDARTGLVLRHEQSVEEGIN